MPIRTLVQMDPPDHLQYRHVSAAWFKPRSIARLEDRAAELAKRYVDHMAELGGECDFVTEVAIQYPLYMILSLLGLPEEDFPRMLKLTQEMFGSSDPELKRDTGGDDLWRRCSTSSSTSRGSSRTGARNRATTSAR